MKIPSFSGFFKAADLVAGNIDLTIKTFQEEEIGQDKEVKWTCSFQEDPRKLVLNPANYELLKGIFGTEDLAEMEGQRITLWRDPTVRGPSGQRGGVRVKAAE